jgi:hypothetical protein
MVQSLRESTRRLYGSPAPVKVVRSNDERFAPGFVSAAPPLTVLAEPGSLAIRISRRDLWPQAERRSWPASLACDVRCSRMTLLLPNNSSKRGE